MAYTKNDIIRQVNQLGYNWKRSTEIIETLFEIIKQRLEDGEDVLVSGFGKFAVKEKASRNGRNPATGKSMKLDARKVVTFRCSGKLRERINACLPPPAFRSTKAPLLP